MYPTRARPGLDYRRTPKGVRLYSLDDMVGLEREADAAGNGGAAGAGDGAAPAPQPPASAVPGIDLNA